MFVLGHHGLYFICLFFAAVFFIFIIFIIFVDWSPRQCDSKACQTASFGGAIDDAAYDFIELIGSFSTMEENWRAFGSRRCWLE